MYLSQALLTGKPVSHPSIIGAYCLIVDKVYHRDNVKDFDDLDWVYTCCEESPISWLCWSWIISDEWFIVE